MRATLFQGAMALMIVGCSAVHPAAPSQSAAKLADARGTDPSRDSPKSPASSGPAAPGRNPAPVMARLDTGSPPPQKQEYDKFAPDPAPQAVPLPDGPRTWSSDYPRVRRDILQGKPLVIHVVIPLCSNAQINCGASWAGQPGYRKTNIYWGAIFGARTIFDGKKSGWERLEITEKDDVYLERVVYRRYVDGESWGLPSGKKVEQLVALQAVHGSKINTAVFDLWKAANDGMQLTFIDGEGPRTETVHVTGYAGHNRLMDGVKLPAPPVKPRAEALPSFVLACYSERYFTDSLAKAGSTNLIATRALMAPEGYLVDAVVKGLGDNLDQKQLLERAIVTYAKWQRISVGTARRIFAKRE